MDSSSSIMQSITKFNTSTKMDKIALYHMRAASVALDKIACSCAKAFCDDECKNIATKFHEGMAAIERCGKLIEELEGKKQIEKAQLLALEKQKSNALLDQSNEVRKRMPKEEERVREEKEIVVQVRVPGGKLRNFAGERERLEYKYRIRVHIPERSGEEVELKGLDYRVAAARNYIMDNYAHERHHEREDDSRREREDERRRQREDERRRQRNDYPRRERNDYPRREWYWLFVFNLYL